MTPMDSEHNHITDVLSYNHYFGWYMGDVEENGPWLDEFHAKNPQLCLGVSEYGAEGVLKWHSAEPRVRDYSEEYQAHYHEKMLETFATRPYLWSTHVWNMFDFAAAAHEAADVAVVSSANRGAVEEEWNRFGLAEHVDILLAQDAGTKAHCIAGLLKKGYDPKKVLMVGDAPGDKDAADANGVWYYPILVRHESESWEKLRTEGIAHLLDGTYEAFGAECVREFYHNLGQD